MINNVTNSSPIDDELSKRIRSLRFILMVFIVFIHNEILKGNITINFSDSSVVIESPLLCQIIQSLANSITHIAVPFFFLISGFLQYTKEPKFMPNLKKKSRTILLPHILWTILLLILFYTTQSIDFTRQYFHTYIIREFSLMDWLGAFTGHFGKFMQEDEHLTHTPLVYQFWFLRDLFVLNLLYVGIRKLIDWRPATTLVFLVLWWISGVDIHILNPSATLFFSLGYYIVKYRLSYKSLDKIKNSNMVIIYAISILANFTFEHLAFRLINIVAGIMFFWKLSYNFVKSKNIYNVLAWLEKYSFWLYASHGLIMNIIIKVSIKILPMNTAWIPLLHYFILTPFIILALVAVGIVIKKAFPKIFFVLTGGR